MKKLGLLLALALIIALGLTSILSASGHKVNPFTAANITYDNSVTGELTANNVQDAIDEIAVALPEDPGGPGGVTRSVYTGTCTGEFPGPNTNTFAVTLTLPEFSIDDFPIVQVWIEEPDNTIIVGDSYPADFKRLTPEGEIEFCCYIGLRYWVVVVK